MSEGERKALLVADSQGQMADVEGTPDLENHRLAAIVVKIRSVKIYQWMLNVEDNFDKEKDIFMVFLFKKISH